MFPGRLDFRSSYAGGGGVGGGGSGGSGSDGVGGGGGGGRHSPVPRANSLPSISHIAGPTFEHEARELVGNIFRELCPWTTDHSRLLTRNLDRGGNGREADIMCYTVGDTLLPCVAQPQHGASLVQPPLPPAPALPPMPLPAGERFSPMDAARTGPHKYFLAEIYCGHQQSVRSEKVQQLETLCEYMKGRWEDQHEGVEGLRRVEDITQVVGAAALVFSAGDESRMVVLRQAEGMVTRSVARCPNLQRLAAAGRLLVVVLDKSQAPNTYFQRAILAQTERVAAQTERLQSIPELLERLARGLAELTAKDGRPV